MSVQRPQEKKHIPLRDTKEYNNTWQKHDNVNLTIEIWKTTTTTLYSSF